MLRLVSFSIDYHWACSRIGIPDVISLPVSWCSRALTPVVAARKRNRRQETSGRLPPLRNVHVRQLYCVCPLRAALHRGTHNHLQRFHVAGRHAPSCLFVWALIFLPSSSPAPRKSRREGRRGTHCAVLFRYLRWRRSFTSCTSSRSRMLARGAV
jgi:hypothetical protein